jgi:hypothetical protein
MKATDNPNISKPVKNLWRFKVRSDLPDGTFYLYFTSKKAGIDYMESEYSIETKQEIHDSIEPVMLDCGNLWYDPRSDIYDYTGQAGMQRVVEIKPPKEVLE